MRRIMGSRTVHYENLLISFKTDAEISEKAGFSVRHYVSTYQLLIEPHRGREISASQEILPDEIALWRPPICRAIWIALFPLVETGDPPRPRHRSNLCESPGKAGGLLCELRLSKGTVPTDFRKTAESWKTCLTLTGNTVASLLSGLQGVGNTMAVAIKNKEWRDEEDLVQAAWIVAHVSAIAEGFHELHSEIEYRLRESDKVAIQDKRGKMRNREKS